MVGVVETGTLGIVATGAELELGAVVPIAGAEPVAFAPPVVTGVLLPIVGTVLVPRLPPMDGFPPAGNPFLWDMPLMFAAPNVPALLEDGFNALKSCTSF
jgi:hypothetical protein